MPKVENNKPEGEGAEEEKKEVEVIPQGAVVEICGLKSEKARVFNGKQGVVMGYHQETFKYDIQIA